MFYHRLSLVCNFTCRYRTFIELRDLVKQQCFGEIKNRHNKWLLQNAELYKNKQLAEWQEPLFKELIQLIMLD